jgi:hypothetical protein
MGTLETAYAMKDGAHFMVASEEVVPDCSWDYASALAKLISAKGRLGAEGLANCSWKATRRSIQGIGISRAGDSAVRLCH